MLSRQLFKSILPNKLWTCHKYIGKDVFKLQHVRRLHLMPSQLAKVYMDRENLHAHQVLEESALRTYQIFPTKVDINTQKSLPELQEIVRCLPESASTSDIFERFQELCFYCHSTNTLISSNDFTALVQQFCDHIHLLNDDQLRASLKALVLLPPEESVRSPNFVELWNILDIECCRRIDKWQTDELLLVCDAWYSLNLSRVCEFVWEALRKMGRKVIKMNPSQLVQTMFLCNVMRRSVFDMFDFEANLAKCVDKMSLDELGVMSMGFFKTQTPIRNTELIAYLYKKLMSELHTVDDITFVAILKVSCPIHLRYKLQAVIPYTKILV